MVFDIAVKLLFIGRVVPEKWKTVIRHPIRRA